VLAREFRPTVVVDRFRRVYQLAMERRGVALEGRRA
jgi:hypothetical protein